MSEIHTLTSPVNWNHMSGKTNPADLLTRGICASDLTDSTQWLQGLVELKVLSSNHDPHDEDIIAEMAKKAEPTLVSVQASSLTDYKRFSHFPKLVKVIGWVLRFVNNLICPSKAQKGHKP